MKIRDLIDLLEQYEHDSAQGEQTNVYVNLSVGVWSVNCSVDAQIEDVMISYGDKDEVHIEVVANGKDVKKAYSNYEKYYKDLID